MRIITKLLLYSLLAGLIISVIIGFSCIEVFTHFREQLILELSLSGEQQILIAAYSAQVVKVCGIIIALGIIAFSIFSYFVSRSLLEPLKDVCDYADKLASGDYEVSLSQTTQLKEVINISRSLDYVRDRLQNVTLKLQQSHHREDDFRREADSAKKLKAEFLTNISRGLRNPLNSVLGFSDILLREAKQGAHNPSANEKIAIIFKSAERLDQLISNLLELSKLNSQDVDINLRNFETSDFLGEVTHFGALDAETKEISLENSFGSDLPPILTTDREILFHIITSLISNAIEISPFGSTVNFGITSEHDELKFWVKDGGAEEGTLSLAEIFIKYIDKESELFRGIKGRYLLNMTIAKAHAELIGSEINAHCQNDNSSTFYISFKLNDIVTSDYTDDNSARFFLSDSSDLGIVESQQSEHDLVLKTPQLIKILMAEKDEYNRILLAEYLDPHSCDVEFVDDGISCIDVLNRREFDLVLLDLHVNKLEGREVVKRIRKNPRFNRLPIIIMTSYVHEEEQQELLMTGANDFLIKPIKKDTLIKMIRSWYERRNEDL